MGNQRDSKQSQKAQPKRSVQSATKAADPISADFAPAFGEPSNFLSPQVHPVLQRRALRNYGRQHGNRQLIQLLSNNRNGRNVIARESRGGSDPTMARIKEINNYGWVGPMDEYELQRLWNSYENRLPQVASDNWAEFQKSQDAGAELDDILWTEVYKSFFKDDVKGLAKGYMAENEKIVLEEMQKIGATPGVCQVVTPEHQARMAELHKVANAIVQIQEADQVLREIPVGYKDTTYYSYGGVWTIEETKYFDPKSEPDRPAKGTEETPFASWGTLNQVHVDIQNTIAAFASQYPPIFTMLQQGEIDKLAEQQSFNEAQLVTSQALNTVYENIIATQPKIDNGDLDWRDLKPIHSQLYGGKKGPTNKDWTQNYLQWAAKDAIGDHESAEFWLSLGLGTLAAAAFLLATFASGGMAAVLVGAGIGAGALQAGMSWEKYLDYAQAAETNLSKNTALVSQGQVDAALLSAILDSVFAVIDVFAPAKAGIIALRGGKILKEAGEAGLKKASMEGLETVADLSTDAARPVIQKGIVELGVDETVKRTGKSLDELAEIVGRDTPEGQRLLSFKSVASGASKSASEAFNMLPDLGKQIADGAITRADADKIVMQAVEQFGPKRVLEKAGGWKKLSSTLGNETPAGDALEAWRASILDDLTDYVTNELKGELKRTGSQGKFSNDMDISFLGPHASEHREKALSFLATRSGTRPNKVGGLLYCDLFTDPRRIHWHDLLDSSIREEVATKAAAFEQELIYARRIFKAHEAGDTRMVELIHAQREQLGIKEVSFWEFSKKDISVLYKEVDELHTALAKTTDPALQKELALEMANKQALINASEGGGYFSGGGVRRLVSERDAFPGFTKGEIASRPLLDTQHLTLIVDQLPKLDEEIIGLTKLLDEAGKKGVTVADYDPAKLFAVLKGIGKYGDRALSVVPKEIRKSIKPSAFDFDQLATDFQRVIEAAGRGADDPKSLIQIIDADKNLPVRARKALLEFEDGQFKLLQAVRKANGIESMEGGLEAIQKWTVIHTKITQFSNATMEQIASVGRMINEARRTAQHAADSSEEGANE